MYNNLPPVSSLTAGLDPAGAMQFGSGYHHYSQQSSMPAPTPSYPMLARQGYPMLPGGQGPPPMGAGSYMYGQQYRPPSDMGLMMGGGYGDLGVPRYMGHYPSYMGPGKELGGGVPASPTLPSLSPSPGLPYPPSSMPPSSLAPTHPYPPASVTHRDAQPPPPMMPTALHNQPILSQPSKFSDHLSNLASAPPPHHPSLPSASSFHPSASYSTADSLADLTMAAASSAPLTGNTTTPINISPITTTTDTTTTTTSEEKSLYSFLDTEKRYMCHQCHYLTFREDKILQHVRAHTGKMICNICSKAFIKTCDLERHMVAHENNRTRPNLPKDPANVIKGTDDIRDDGLHAAEAMGSHGQPAESGLRMVLNMGEGDSRFWSGAAERRREAETRHLGSLSNTDPHVQSGLLDYPSAMPAASMGVSSPLPPGYLSAVPDIGHHPSSGFAPPHTAPSVHSMSPSNLAPPPANPQPATQPSNDMMYKVSGLLSRLPPADDVAAMRSSYFHHTPPENSGGSHTNQTDPSRGSSSDSHKNKLLRAQLAAPSRDYPVPIRKFSQSPPETDHIATPPLPPPPPPLPPRSVATSITSRPMMVPEPTLSSALSETPNPMPSDEQSAERPIVRVENTIHQTSATAGAEGGAIFENSEETSPELPRIESVCSMNVEDSGSLLAAGSEEAMSEISNQESTPAKDPTPPPASESSSPISATDPKIVSIDSVSPEKSPDTSTTLRDFINLRRAVLGISPSGTPPGSPTVPEVSTDTSTPPSAPVPEHLDTMASLMPSHPTTPTQDFPVDNLPLYANPNGLISPVQMAKKPPMGIVETQGKVPIYRCDVCSYSTKNPGHLEKHFQAHTNNFKSCRYCQKAFERPSDLVRHEERHEIRFSQTGSHNLGPNASRPKFSSNYLKKPKRKYMGTSSYSKFLQNRLNQYRATTMQLPYRGPPMGYFPEVSRPAMAALPHSTPPSLPPSHMPPIPVSMTHLTPSPPNTAFLPPAPPIDTDPDLSHPEECSKCNRRFRTLEELDQHLYTFHLKLPSRLDTYEKSTLISTSLIQCHLLGNNVVELQIEHPSSELMSSETVPHVSAPRDLDHIKHKTISAQQSQIEVYIEIEDPPEPPPDVDAEEMRAREALASQRQALSENASQACGPAGSLGLPGVPDDLREDLEEEDLPPMEVEEEEQVVPPDELALPDGGPSTAADINLDMSSMDTLQGPSLTTSSPDDTVFKHPSLVTGSRENYRSPGKAHLGSSSKNRMRSTTQFYCARCNYGTNMPHKFAQHEKAHQGRWICKYCQKACIKLSDLTRHWASHVELYTPDGTFPCDSCTFRTRSRDIMEEHMKRHYMTGRSGNMKLAPPEFSTNPNLPKFIPKHKSNLPADRDDRFDFLEDNCVYCDDCGAGFSTSSQLKRHRQAKHIKRKKPRSRDFPCPQCGRFMPSQFLLDRHVAAHANHPNGMGGNTCKYCHKMFRSKGYRKQHERLHTGETPYRCHCGAKFALSQTLKVHEKSCTLPAMITDTGDTNSELSLVPIPTATENSSAQEGRTDTTAETSVSLDKATNSTPVPSGGQDGTILAAQPSSYPVTDAASTVEPPAGQMADSMISNNTATQLGDNILDKSRDSGYSSYDTSMTNDFLAVDSRKDHTAKSNGGDMISDVPFPSNNNGDLSVPFDGGKPEWNMENHRNQNRSQNSEMYSGHSSDVSDFNSNGLADSNLNNNEADLGNIVIKNVLQGACSQIMDVSTGIDGV